MKFEVLIVILLTFVFMFVFRKIREVERLLEYERVKREKLEAQLDKMRLHIHKLNLQLEDAQSRIPVTVSAFL